MYVKMEVESFWWLEDNCWSGALDRLKEIKENIKKKKKSKELKYILCFFIC